MALKPIGGTVFLKIDGDSLALLGNITSNVGQTKKRETKTGLDGVHGFTENHVTPFIQCDITEKASFDLEKINAVTDSTITAELADGRTLILRNAWHVGDSELNPEDASLSVRFEGMSGERSGGA